MSEEFEIAEECNHFYREAVEIAEAKVAKRSADDRLKVNTHLNEENQKLKYQLGVQKELVRSLMMTIAVLKADLANK